VTSLETVHPHYGPEFRRTSSCVLLRVVSRDMLAAIYGLINQGFRGSTVLVAVDEQDYHPRTKRDCLGQCFGARVANGVALEVKLL